MVVFGGHAVAATDFLLQLLIEIFEFGDQYGVNNDIRPKAPHVKPFF